MHIISSKILCIQQPAPFQHNIGIIHHNPSTTEGAIAIGERLQDFVPWLPDGPVVTPCHLDQGAHERLTDAKRARNAEDTPRERLQGLEKVQQDFHHRGIMLQVILT